MLSSQDKWMGSCLSDTHKIERKMLNRDDGHLISTWIPSEIGNCLTWKQEVYVMYSSNFLVLEFKAVPEWGLDGVKGLLALVHWNQYDLRETCRCLDAKLTCGSASPTSHISLLSVILIYKPSLENLQRTRYPTKTPILQKHRQKCLLLSHMPPACSDQLDLAGLWSVIPAARWTTWCKINLIGKNWHRKRQLSTTMEWRCLRGLSIIIYISVDH
mgnify:CR=1 FL=1